MNLLGIDYGEKKIGLAISTGKLAEPLSVLRVKTEEEAIKKVIQVVQVEHVGQVIIGMSEGETAEKTKIFVEKLRNQLLPIPVEVYDETLSTHEAQELSRQTGMTREKRRSMEDAFAASVILQNYLDSTNA